MIPLMQREVVGRRQWLTPEEFLDAMCVAQSTPGVMAVNTAVFIGYRVAGVSGIIAAALGAIIPSFAVTLGVVALFFRYQAHPLVARFFGGVRPAVLALIAGAAWELSRTALRDKPSWFIAGATFVLGFAFKVHPAWLIAGGIVAGLAVFGKGERGA